MSDSSNVPAAPTRATTMKLRDAKTIGDALQTSQFQRAVADALPAHMTAQRMMATFRQAARNNPAFNECNLMSVLGVMMTCTFLGLEPNTPQGHAYMIPFKKKRYDKAARKLVDDGYDLQLVIGYQGYLDLAYRSPRVSSIAAHAVHEGDDFSFEYGSNEHLQHRPKGLHADDDVPRYFYMFAKLTHGQSFEVLPLAKVLRTRNASQGYAAALAAKERAEKEGWKLPAAWTEAPWVKHFTAMGQKTAMRAGYKWLPKTVEMAAVERLEDAQDRGMIDFGPVLEGNVNPLDEDLPMLHEPRAEPGAAFGERDGAEPQEDAAPPVAQPTQAPVQRETKPAPKPADPPPPQQQPAAATAEAFDAYLADASGELVTTVGRGGHFTNPVEWVNAYAALWRATVSGQREALSEHNADALADAFNGSIEAAELLDGLTDAQEPAATAQESVSTPQAIHVITTDGKPDLRGYVASLRASAEQQTAQSIDAWAAVQRPVITALSQVTRKQAEKIVADRLTALGADKAHLPKATTPATSPQPTQSDEPPPHTDEDAAAAAGDADNDAPLIGETMPAQAWGRDAQDLVNQLNACANLHQINALANNPAIKVQLRKIAEANPDEGARLREFAAARRDALMPPGQQ